MTTSKRNVIIIPSVAAVIVVGAIVGIFFAANQGDASENANCLPATLESVDADYPIKEPSVDSMPNNFALKAVDNPGGVVILYYADHSLCPFTESFDGQIKNGAIVVTVTAGEDVATDSADFQQQELDYYAAQKETIADVQALDVNGNRGIGWEPFTGTSTITFNGEVSSTEDLPMPGMIRFYHDQDHTIYSISAFQPLDTLLEIAQSIR